MWEPGEVSWSPEQWLRALLLWAVGHWRGMSQVGWADEPAVMEEGEENQQGTWRGAELGGHRLIMQE